MSKKFNNFLTVNKTTVRKTCYAWIALVILGAVLLSAYFIYFADWSAVQITHIGLTPAQYMTMIGVSVAGILTVYMLMPAWAILSKIKKLSA